MAVELLQHVLGCGILDVQKAQELINEYKLPADRIAELMREDLIWNYEADPVGAVFRWVKNQLPETAKVELSTNYLDTHMDVSIPKEDFEELPSNIQRFLENECNLTIVEEEKVSTFFFEFCANF